MISIRTIVVSLLTIALSAFATPGIAGNKTFDLKAESPVNVGQQIKISFTNRDDGNSSFNSVSVTGAPGSGTSLQITNATQTGSSKPGKPVISADGKSVTFTDLSPIKVGQTLTLTLTVNDNTAACSSGSIRWTGAAWTGSPSTPSNPFTTVDSPTTDLSARTCGVSFVTQPKRALKAQPITAAELDPAGTKVKVGVTLNGGPAVNAPVTLTSSCTTQQGLTLTGVTGATDSGGSVEFGNLRSSTIGSNCTLTATATLGTATRSATSQTFNVVDAKVVLTDPLPTSFAPNSSAPVTAKLVTADTSTLIPQTGFGTMTVSSACTPSPLTASTTTGVLTFGGVSGVTAGGSCTLLVEAEFYGAKYVSQTGPYPVFANGNLQCDDLATTLPDPPVPNTTSYFAALPQGVTKVTDIGYAAGYRAQNDKGGRCPPTNYTFTNNIKGGNATDAAGNTLPINAVSFVWDETSQPQAVFTYTLTFAPEFADDISGLPTRKRTKFCRLNVDPATNKPAPTDCADVNPTTTKQVPLKACLGTALNTISIPGDDPACIAREEWTTLPMDSCGTYTGSAQEAPACIRVTNKIIDARDPPIIRGDF